MKLVSRALYVQRLVELLAGALDMNRHQRLRAPRRHSRREALSVATSRCAFRYNDDDLADDETPQ
jgi:hypothetical protein